MKLSFFSLLIVSFSFLFECSLHSFSFLSDEEIATYYKQGYFIKKGALSKEQVQVYDQASSQLIDYILNEIDKDTYPYQQEDQSLNLNGSQVVFLKQVERPLSIKRIVGCGSANPVFLNLLRLQDMLQTFFGILKTKHIEHLICQIHPKLPGDGVIFKKHRDRETRENFDPEWKDIGGNGSYALCCLAIDPMNQENGGLILDVNSYPPSEITQNPKEQPCLLEPGDMLFIHPEILHWSGTNTSTKSRRVLLSGFCIYGANHKKYPGECVNTVITKGSHQIVDAPWKHGDQKGHIPL